MKNRTGMALLTTAIFIALNMSGCNVDSMQESKYVNTELEKNDQSSNETQQENNVGQSASDKMLKTSTGVIAEIGNRFVLNNVTYDVSEAIVYIAGQTSDISALKQGMLVSITSEGQTSDSPKALEIFYKNDVNGMVSDNSVDIDGVGHLHVLGQTVFVNKDTVFDSYDDTDQNTSDIEVGNVIEVSGHASGDGSIWASRIEVRNIEYNSGEEISVKGNISSLDDNSFTIGDLHVNYGNAVLDHNLINGLQVGQYIETKSFNGFDKTGYLIADELQLEDNGVKEVRHGENDDSVEIKGVITQDADLSETEVNGARIIFDEKLQISSTTLSQLKVGERVKLEGYINSDGQFVATYLQLEFHDELQDDDANQQSDDMSNEATSHDSDDANSSISYETSDTTENTDEINEDSDDLNHSVNYVDIIEGNSTSTSAIETHSESTHDNSAETDNHNQIETQSSSNVSSEIDRDQDDNNSSPNSASSSNDMSNSGSSTDREESVSVNDTFQNEDVHNNSTSLGNSSDDITASHRDSSSESIETSNDDTRDESRNSSSNKSLQELSNTENELSDVDSRNESVSTEDSHSSSSSIGNTSNDYLESGNETHDTTSSIDASSESSSSNEIDSHVDSTEINERDDAEEQDDLR